MPITRWYHDPGAIPGEPFAYLDVPFNQLEYAAAVVIQIDTDDREHPQYQAILGRPIQEQEPDLDDISPLFLTRHAAEAWAESRCPTPQPHIPVTIVPEIMIQERYHPEPGEVLISIQRENDPPIVPLAPFAAMLSIADSDLTRTIHDDTLGTLHPMTMDTALTIIQFVLQHRNRMTKLVIHCHAGVRRSPAVAIGLAEWLPTMPSIHDLIEKHPCFNRHIYRRLCDAGIRLNLIPT